jgi:DUF1365 family protein
VGLNSCLYECVIVHRRLRPRQYAFEHKMMMLYADLDELDAIDRGSRLLSRERGNLYSFRDADYFPTGTPGDLKCRVSAWLQRTRGRHRQRRPHPAADPAADPRLYLQSDLDLFLLRRP